MRTRRAWVPWSTRRGADLGPSRGAVLGAIAALVLALGALFMFAPSGDGSSDLGSVVTSETAATVPTTGVPLPVTTTSGGAVPTAPSTTSATAVAQLPPVAPAASTVVPAISAVPTPTTAQPATTGSQPATTGSQPATTGPSLVSTAPSTVETTAPFTPGATTTTSLSTSPPLAAPIASGSPFILSDPLPSGLSARDAAPSLAVAQRLADALSAEDWATVRRIDQATAGYSDQSFIVGYRGLDRASLLLVDAHEASAGYRLLFVSVANELGGAQSSLYCLEWTANPDDGTIEQHGGNVGLIARVSSVISPDDVRNDQGLMDAIGTRCRWT